MAPNETEVKSLETLGLLQTRMMTSIPVRGALGQHRDVGDAQGSASKAVRVPSSPV